MRLAPGERRNEDAHEPEIAFQRPNDVGVVLVERVERAGLDRPLLSGRDFLHFAFAAEAVVRLDVVLVVELQLDPSFTTVSCSE